MTPYDDSVLWRSDDPRFGTVREVFVEGEHAMRYDDTNSDGREICLTVFRRGGTGWEQLFSVDDVGLSNDDTSGWSSAGDHGYAWGRHNGQPYVRIEDAPPWGPYDPWSGPVDDDS